tara:strand:- start:396 stop:599 length:204 start_codon:yes stop_codon:yes gene_type:complete
MFHVREVDAGSVATFGWCFWGSDFIVQPMEWLFAFFRILLASKGFSSAEFRLPLYFYKRTLPVKKLG